MLFIQPSTPIDISTNNLLAIGQPEEIEIQVEPPEPTLEEKITSNHYECDTDTQWISAETAECIDKAVPLTQETAKNVYVEPVIAYGHNGYVKGQCTWHAKNATGWVPNGWGNARNWASNARRQGYTVSSTPVVGSVAQHSRGQYGHVAVVQSVNGNTVTVSEMNYNGKKYVTTRTAPVSSFVYIY